MGLDTYQLVMGIEDRFGTALPDSEAEKMRTIGDLHAFLVGRIEKQNAETCHSAALFYLVRRILADEFDVDRTQIRPSTKLTYLVDKSDRQSFWIRAEESLTTRLPKLKKSGWLQWRGDVFPEHCQTVEQLIRLSVDLNRITEQFGPDDADAVWMLVCELVGEFAGVDEAKLTKDTEFAAHLGF